MAVAQGLQPPVRLAHEDSVTTAYQERARDVLHDYEPAVAEGKEEGELVSAGRRRSSVVQRDGARGIPAFVTCQPGAEAQIDVLVEGEEILVEEADLL
jgi:hypothetical protein